MITIVKYVIPKTPCNIDPLIGASLIGLGVSGIGSAIGAISADKTNKQNYQYQRALMQEQHTLGLQNLRQQHHYNIDSLNAAYALENQYNSPLAQKSRMLDAGLNPYYNEAGAVSAQSNPNPTSVGLPSSTLPSYQFQSPWAAFANMPVEFANVANATKAIAEARKVGVDTTLQERAMEDYLNDIHEKWRGSKLANDYQEVITNWYQENGASYLNEQDRKLSIEIGNLCAQGNLADAQKLLVNAQKENQIKNNALFDKIEGFLEEKAKWEAKLPQAQFGATKAQEGMFNAQSKAAIIGAQNQTRLTNAQVDKLRKDGFQVDALRKLTDAQMKKLAQEVVGVYVTDNGLEYVSQNEQQEMQRMLYEGMKTAVEQGKSDLFNPFRYVGGFFGGASNTIIGTLLK